MEAEFTALATSKISKSVAKTLTTVPAEIRQLIFKEIFASTTVYIGFDDSEDETSSADSQSAACKPYESIQSILDDGTSLNNGSSASTLSTENSSLTNTNILRTCRMISIEATPLLAPHITLSIWSTKAMIDYFSTLRPEIIQNLRYLRLQEGFPIPLYTQLHRNSFTTFHVSDAFCMFPGLQLDLLTVGDCYHVEGCYYRGGADSSNVGTYQAVDGLIRIDGWKELHFITPTTQFIFALDRDGRDSSASVRMFVGMQPDVVGLTEDPETRLDYAAIAGHGLEIEGYENESPEEQRRHSESREVLVVAKRGVGASYIQDGSDLHQKIKILLSKMNWQEILADGRYLDPEDRPELML
ncbi:hypothetical protein V8E51_019226 [Hyaloscypha variabilis]